MLLKEKNIIIPADNKKQSFISYFESYITDLLSEDEVPVRFVVTSSDEKNYHCELGVLSGLKEIPGLTPTPIFKFVEGKGSE